MFEDNVLVSNTVLTHGPLRMLCGGIGGGLIGGIQYGLVAAGMSRGHHANGLTGIGVAARYGLVTLAVSFAIAMLIMFVLRTRLWVLAAMISLLLEGFVLLLTWNHLQKIGLHGDHRAVVLLILPIFSTALVLVRWPQREDPLRG